MAFKFADRVRCVTATTGTGTITIGAAATGFRTFAAAVADSQLTSGNTIYYGIQDGSAWECGTGVYAAGSPDTLTRSVSSSSLGGTTALTLSGNAQVFLTLTALSTVTALITGGTITGAAIDNAAIGANTPTTGAFTTINTSGIATLNQANTNTVSSTVNTSQILFKNGPAGSILMRIGGSGNTIEADTNIVLPGGTWGSGNLINNSAPILQNASFVGTTSGATACFGAFLQQTDNSATAASSTGTITIGTNPANGDTLTLNGTLIHFVTSGATSPDVNIGGTAALTATALYTMLAASSDTQLIKCWYDNPSSGVVNVTTRTFSTSNNAFTLASSVSPAKIQFSATTLLGGLNEVAGYGLYEHLILNGSSVCGSRTAGMFIIDINVDTNNPIGKQYAALGTKCNLMATDGGQLGVDFTQKYAVAFGFNPVAHIGAGVTASGCIGTEINTWMETGAVVLDRIGLQIVDVSGTTFGTQATRDDVALTFNNQYGPSTGLGWKIGLAFGRSGGGFPVATDGTLIYGTGTSGSGFTVANGIDWNLGTVTGNWLNMGGVFIVDGTGLTTTTTLSVTGATTSASYKVGSNQVVGARVTGYTAMTGSADKATSYSTSGVTLAQLAGRVMQLQADLTTHGIIGA